MTAVLGRGSRQIWAWAFYDFANSPFTTLVVTFVYSTYFTQAIASDPIRGTALWSRAVTVTALIVAFCSPFLGALADRGGYRKLFVFISTLICVGGSAALYRVLPGQTLLALSLFVTANVAYEFGTVFYNAYLPDIAASGRIGRVSGFGWGFGYIGGLLALVVALVTLIQPQTPWFGFAKAAGENIRATNLVVAVWLALFSIPLFVWVKDAKRPRIGVRSAVEQASGQLRHTFSEVRKYRQIVRFLVARLIYNDALVTIFAFGGIYAAETFGFSVAQVLVFGIVINLAAGIGAIAMGFLDDKLGSKHTIMASLGGLIIATLLAVFSTHRALFWVAGIIIGIFAGPNQASSRSLMGRLVPHDMENEFFGFFAFSGKLTAFIGPFLLGLLTELSGSQRVGVSVVLVLFVIGAVLLARVDEKAGVAAHHSASKLAAKGAT